MLVADTARGESAGYALRVVHPMDVLDASYRGAKL
jgi:hypothetical protein